MATRCFIGILESNNKIKAIYCHNNGSPEDTGAMLLNHYNNESLAKQLIELGDISVLRQKIKPNPNKTHTFDNPQPDVTVAYTRDRGEDSTRNEAKLYNSKADYIAHATATYLYLYDIQQQVWKYTIWHDNKNCKFRNIPKKFLEE